MIVDCRPGSAMLRTLGSLGFHATSSFLTWSGPRYRSSRLSVLKRLCIQEQGKKMFESSTMFFPVLFVLSLGQDHLCTLHSRISDVHLQMLCNRCWCLAEIACAWEEIGTHICDDPALPVADECNAVCQRLVQILFLCPLHHLKHQHR